VRKRGGKREGKGGGKSQGLSLKKKERAYSKKKGGGLILNPRGGKRGKIEGTRVEREREREREKRI
jgi:hypothetical protein